jgi:hypothetical protein
MKERVLFEWRKKSGVGFTSCFALLICLYSMNVFYLCRGNSVLLPIGSPLWLQGCLLEHAIVIGKSERSVRSLGNLTDLNGKLWSFVRLS